MGAAATFIVGDALFNKGHVTNDVQGATLNAIGKGPKPAAPSAAPPALNDTANENDAQKAAERRRRLYAGIGRSSTILTGPKGLGSLGDNNQTPKMLLGV